MASKVIFAIVLGFAAVAYSMPAASLVNINQPEYQLSLNYFNQNAVEDVEGPTTTAENLVPEKSAEQPTINNAQETPVENEPTEEDAPSTEAIPADHELKQQITTLNNGAVRYAYQGQTQHDEQSSSRVSHSMVRNGPTAPPAPETPYHKMNLLPATKRGEVLAYHAGVAATNAISYQQHLPPLPPLTPAEARIFREQIFTVNVAAPQYGYGYTVRGIEHPQQ
ncbi:uncharacterized protein LOC132202382 [Neocloeon triangulifer]|uniref:uncharacterized protein LOC132202382 n=1 Tax=Neocloeon triangulifer TaxID=2078957 RepID=UPI00286EB4F1|nr:uncharacterized protein LOC132202382 [Neocloeon triangulifer]